MNIRLLYVFLPRILNRMAGNHFAWRDAIAAVQTIEGAVRHGKLNPAERTKYFEEALSHVVPKGTKNRTRIINILREAAVTYNDLQK